MARIIVAASPLSGHVLPMVLIGAHLQRCGHTVTVLTDEGHRDIVEQARLAFEPLAPDACPAAPSSPSVLNRLLPNLIRRFRLGKADIRATFIAPLIAQYRALEPLLNSADVVLADLAFTGALALVASDRPRPAVMVCGVGPLTLTSANSAPFGMAWTPRPGMDYGGMHLVVHRIMFKDIHNELNAALNSVGAASIDVSLMDWPRLADRLLQLTVPDFEYPRRDLPDNVDFIGPVLAESAEGFEPPPWWADLLRADTVVHVTQGTLDNGDFEQLMLPTMRAFAGRDDVVVVATTGRGGMRRLPDRLPANVHAAEWIPYSMLLPHVDVMVTNGGYGGVQHALSYGIPVVVGGETADKAEVAARVGHTGVGVNLGTAHPTPSAIVEAVRQASECREAAARVGAVIAQSAPLDEIAALLATEAISA